MVSTGQEHGNSFESQNRSKVASNFDALPIIAPVKTSLIELDVDLEPLAVNNLPV